MTLQYSTTLRNNQLDQVEATVGTSPRLRLYTGAPPANCAAAASGTLLLDITLPADWMSAAAAGVKAKLGTWAAIGEAGAGTGTNAGHFRLWDSAIAVCSIQGTVTVTGGGGDMTLDNINIASAQAVAVSGFQITAGNP